MAETPETTEVPAPEETTPMTIDDLKKPHEVAHPDVKKFKASEEALKAEVDAIEEQIKAVVDKTRAAQQKASGQDESVSGAHAELKRLKKEKDALLKQRQELFALRDETRETQTRQVTEMAKIKSQTKYKTIEEIDAAMKKLEVQQATTSMPLNQEKALIKELSELRASRKVLVQHKAAFETEGVKPSREALNAQLDSLKAQLDQATAQINAHKNALGKMYEDRKSTPVQGLNKKKTELKAEKKAKLEELSKLREEFRGKMNAWRKYQDEWKEYKVKRDKLYKAEQERRKEEERKLREEELLKKTPYEEEMQLCDYLCNYLNTTFGKAAAAVSEKKPAAAAAAEPRPSREYGVEGGVALESKKGKEEPYLALGKGKKAKGKKGKAQKNKAIVLCPETIDAFSLLKVEPPVSVEQVLACVETLREKKAYFSTLPRGEVESIAEMNQKIESQRENRSREDKPKKSRASGALKTDDIEAFPTLVSKASEATA